MVKVKTSLAATSEVFSRQGSIRDGLLRARFSRIPLLRILRMGVQKFAAFESRLCFE
jgi:hypothetical protein